MNYRYVRGDRVTVRRNGTKAPPRLDGAEQVSRA
jgi:hypothetical protein